MCVYVCVCVVVVVVVGGVYKWLVQIILWLAQRLETSKIMETWEMLLIWIWFSWAGRYGVPFYYLFPFYGYPKFIWISIIHFWISKNRFMDILKYIFGYPKISWILDIHNSIFWYPKMNYGYPKIHPDFWISIIILWYPKFIFGDPKIELWISKNRIMDILNSAWFLDIQKWIFGYPKIHWFLDIQKWIMDTQKSNYGYPKFSMIFGYPKMYFRIS